MPSVVIPHPYHPEQGLPEVCFVTGETEEVSLVALTERVFDVPWYLAMVIAAAGVGVEWRDVEVTLPLSPRGRELSRSLDRVRLAVQRVAGFFAIGSAFAGALHVLFGQGSYVECLLIMGLGCTLAILTMATLELVVIPRRRPILKRERDGWVQLSIPSGRAAKLIGNMGWPREWGETASQPDGPYTSYSDD